MTLASPVLLHTIHPLMTANFYLPLGAPDSHILLLTLQLHLDVNKRPGRQSKWSANQTLDSPPEPAPLAAFLISLKDNSPPSVRFTQSLWSQWDSPFSPCNPQQILMASLSKQTQNPAIPPHFLSVHWSKPSGRLTWTPARVPRSLAAPALPTVHLLSTEWPAH